ncbi:MAG TPA: FIST C-terminal domain-containing protein [Gallionella sp.]|nr:FIST C-terminal domain-containing protein [Gallionella sp.]
MERQNMMRFIPALDDAAIREALLVWQAVYPKMGVLAMLPEADKEAVSQLQRECSQLGIPLVGGIFPALVRNGEFCTCGVWLLCFDVMPYAALHEGLPGDAAGAERAAKEIAERIRNEIDDTPDVTLFMMFDAMVPNIGTMLDTLYLQLANRVHYAGVNAGSETFQPMPCLFDGERIIQNGVLTVLLQSHNGAILEHGYRAPAKTVYATSTEGNRISQIDWRPAFDVYRELVRAQYQLEITRENFYQHAVHFPFGIVRANHHVLVRIPVMLGEDGSLFCVGEVPPNSVLTLLERPSVDSGHTLKVLIDGLTILNGSSAGKELLLFYCAGRRLHLGLEAATGELSDFVKSTEASQVAGALSLGEIGGSTAMGYPLFHNATLVAAGWCKG